MTRRLRAALLVSAVSASPALGADTCTDLCDAAFYATATAQTVQHLIDSGVDVNSRDAAGKSALYWVASAETPVISTLLAAGADVNARDHLDRMPLHFVAASGSVENIRALLEAGADVNGKTANDWTPIHGAARFGTPENVLVLLEAGADAAARTEMGETAFDFGLGNQKLADSEVLKVLEEGR